MISDLYVNNHKINQDVCSPVGVCRKGVMSKDDILSKIVSHNFKINCWQDYTEYLTNFFCQMIMNNHSGQDFWENVMNCDAHHLSCKVKYGYYLLIAEKN